MNTILVDIPAPDDSGVRISGLLERRRGLASAMLILVALLCFAATLKISGPQLSWDSMDYAQCARQLARGEGFTSKVLVGELTDGYAPNGNLTAPWLNTLRAPLPVYAMAASFRLFGESDLAVCYWAGIFFVATCWLMFRAFSPLFGFPVAFLSALIFAVSRCGLAYARAGLTESAAMFSLVLLFALVQKELNLFRSLAIGLVFGIASLNRPIALVWMAGFVAVILLCEANARRQLISLGAAVAGVSVVLLFSRFGLGWASGRTAFALNLAFDVGDPHQAYTAPVSFVLSHPLAYVSKVARQFARPLVYLFRFGDIPVISGIAPFGLLLCLNEKQRKGRLFLLAALAANTLSLSMLIAGDAFVGPLRYFDVFAPLALPWAVQLLMQFSNKLSQNQRHFFWLLFLLALAGTGYEGVRIPFPVRSHPDIYASLRDTIAQNEVVAASDAANPPAVAWYADRRAVLVEPNATGEILKMRSQGLQLSWFLTMQSDPAPAGFRTARTWPDGLILWHSVNPLPTP
jgi:4-amino-4-deoxy-L-arabinose transferase-like glycosyltransferase